MSGVSHFVVVALDDQRFAFPLSSVERVVRAVYVTPLPQAPPIVLGIVNVHGRIIPVLNLRERCGIAAHEIELDHQMVIAQSSRRTIAFIVDSSEVIACDDQTLMSVDEIASGLDSSRKIIGHAQGMILVYDLNSLMSLNDEIVLSGAIDDHHGRGAS